MATTQSAVARAESGWTRVPSLDWIERYAAAVGRPITLTIGARADRAELARRAELVLGTDFEQNPWDRQPSQMEARSLNARGLTRDRFKRRRTSPPRG